MGHDEAASAFVSGEVDVRVQDSVALDEIELVGDVLVAVAVTERSLTAEELDRALGLETT